MKLSPHFTLDEFTASQEACRRGLSNDLPIELYLAAGQTCAMLERIREFLSEAIGKPAPIIITSAYRSPAVNAAVGGKPTSDHTRAQAVDWHCPEIGRPHVVAKLLAPHVDRLGIGQLINEFPSASGGWVHTSTALPVNAVNRVITITSNGVLPGVVGEA